MVVWRQAQLCSLPDQFLQQLALRYGQGDCCSLLGQAGSLLYAQVITGPVQGQQHDALHAAGQQCFAGLGSQMHGIGERAGLCQQLLAQLAPMAERLAGGRWRRQHVRVRATLFPRPDQGLGRVEQGMLGVPAGTGGGLLVNLLLHVLQ